MKKLELAIKRIGAQLTSEKLEKLRKFGDLIEKNNQSQNLTGHKSWNEIRDNLFIRSFSNY
jgi:16S rRNA G527 N7-methylase RsmG